MIALLTGVLNGYVGKGNNYESRETHEDPHLEAEQKYFAV